MIRRTLRFRKTKKAKRKMKKMRRMTLKALTPNTNSIQINSWKKSKLK